MYRPMTKHTLGRVRAATILSTACLLAASGWRAHAASASAPAVVAVTGETTTWTLSLSRIRGMQRIPHTSWRGYNANVFQTYVLTLQLTNTGGRAAAPAHDLTLTMKVTEPQYAPRDLGAYAAGYTEPEPKGPFVAMLREAARQYGGVPAWTVARPGHALTYSYVILTNRGNSHYGLYNAPPYKKYIYLLDTGV